MSEIPALTEPSQSDVAGKVKEKESDFTTKGIVPGRTFYISFGFIRFGTRDPIQGAAFFLAFILLLMLLSAFIIELFVERTLTATFIDWIDTPLMLAIGVAIGRSGEISTRAS